MRLNNKVAIVTGAGQTPGDTIGNGRATAILFAREGARVALADINLESAEETAQMIRDEGGNAVAIAADVSLSSDAERVAKGCLDAFGDIDILHNNVGIGTRDGGPVGLAEEDWDHIMNVNLKSMYLMAKFVLPHMRDRGKGTIVNISSVAAIASTGMLAYKTSKAGVIALTQNIASGNARYGIRANCILPGLMNTPMAVEGYAAMPGRSKDEVIAARNARVPLKQKMGSG